MLRAMKMSLKKRTERVNFEVLLKSIKKTAWVAIHVRDFVLGSDRRFAWNCNKISVNKCVNCGQYLINCLFGTIEQMSFVDKILKHLDDPKSFAVVHPSPAVRVSIAEDLEGIRAILQ